MSNAQRATRMGIVLSSAGSDSELKARDVGVERSFEPFTADGLSGRTIRAWARLRNV
jgi:hypothetical protein